jgi:hypothetical protein
MLVKFDLFHLRFESKYPAETCLHLGDLSLTEWSDAEGTQAAIPKHVGAFRPVGPACDDAAAWLRCNI